MEAQSSFHAAEEIAVEQTGSISDDSDLEEVYNTKPSALRRLYRKNQVRPWTALNVHCLDWLKATVLCFPKMFRMIPYCEYAPEDTPQIQRYVQPDQRGHSTDNYCTAEGGSLRYR